jgi:hypothetical protein
VCVNVKDKFLPLQGPFLRLHAHFLSKKRIWLSLVACFGSWWPKSARETWPSHIVEQSIVAIVVVLKVCVQGAWLGTFLQHLRNLLASGVVRQCSPV